MRKTVGLAGSGADFTADPQNADAAINAALTAVGESGAVHVYAGAYGLKAAVAVGAYQALYGDGPAQTVLTAQFSGPAVVKASGIRTVLRDFAANAANRCTNGVLVTTDSAPTRYGPDPQPILNRLFVFQTLGDGYVLGGAYGGGCREFRVSDCRAQAVGGWGFNWSGSSDGFVSNCSVQGAKGGGYNVAGGNSKVWGCKGYGIGAVGAPAPVFRVSSSRCTVTSCEAQDTYGNGYEILAEDANVEGCTADSCGTGTDPDNSAGFVVAGARALVVGKSYMSAGRGARWIADGAGQMYAIRLTGAPRQWIRVVSGDTVDTWQGNVYGTASADSRVAVI